MNKKMELTVIGQVKRNGEGILLEIFPEFRSALTELENFSHVVVLGWIDQEVFPGYREVLTTQPPYAPGHTSGVFATRSPFRPNPILTTVCKIEDIDLKNGLVKVNNLDMFDGTPLIDLKAYFPVTDRVQDASIAPWLADWPEWYPEEGIGLEPYELEA